MSGRTDEVIAVPIRFDMMNQKRFSPESFLIHRDHTPHVLSSLLEAKFLEKPEGMTEGPAFSFRHADCCVFVTFSFVINKKCCHFHL